MRAGELDGGRPWRQKARKELSLASMCVGELTQGFLEGGGGIHTHRESLAIVKRDWKDGEHNQER